MGSFRENCEITEEKDEPRTRRSWQERSNNKPPFAKKGYNRSLEDDINKLFESINLRSSKSVDPSDARRNNSKRPMRADTGSNSPGIGFSEPVSLKQALRGLCISQAAEMAAIKRMSMAASPRVSEAGKIRTTHSPVLAETGEPGCSRLDNRGQKIEISLVPEENRSSSSSRMMPSLVKPVVENLEHDNSGDVGIVIDRCSAKKQPTESVLQNEIKESLEIDIQLVSSPPHDNARDNLTKQEQKISGSIEIKISAPNLVRRKNSSSVVKGNKGGNNSIKITSRAVKPVIINKNLVIRKLKKTAVPKDLNRVQDDRSGPLICHKCQCSLMDTVEKDIPVVKTKPDISQSSKSSVCEFSSCTTTTTSLSDESNLSGSSCRNSRPHMSKDARWEAISLVRKKYGFLGLSHFNLLKKLGSGDIGTVYLAELVGTGCPFAIKVMDNEFLGKRKKMGRAQTEKEILRMLDHPFLPTLYAQFTSDNLSCLVMEFCPGGDLHVLRQKQPARYFLEYAARFYVAEVLLALEYLHMLGIVYRDLKPENILVREDGHIMLTDFDLSLRCSVNPTLVKSSSPTAIEPPRISGPCTGSSCIDPFCSGPSSKMSCFSPRLLPSTATARARKLKEAESIAARSLPQLVAEPTEARSNSFVGTHEYLAPEIIKGQGHGSAVDWWTLGVFLYELLYGKTPFKGADNDDTLSNVVVRGLRFPNTPIVSFQARDLIRGLLAKDPASRVGTETGTAEIKRHPFFEGLNWALIRCGSPLQVPETCDVESLRMGFGEKGKGFLGCGGDGERLEFELF